MKTTPSGADALDVAMSKACIHSWDQSQFTSGDCDAVHPMFSMAFEAGYRAALSAAQEAPTEEVEALNDMLSDARLQLDMLREALGVKIEPHQSLFERMMDAARGAQPMPAAIKATVTDALIFRHDAGEDQDACDRALNWLSQHAAPVAFGGGDVR